MDDPRIAQTILDLAHSNRDATTFTATKMNVLYLGTATYDLPGPKERQTRRLLDLGCTIQSLDVATHTHTHDPTSMEETISQADIIIVSGGNTLYAVDQWKRLGLDDMLRRAVDRGAVLTGGSAGAICWFDGGHSDSMDPDSFRATNLAGGREEGKDEASAAPQTPDDAAGWEYIRVNGLGVLPGLVCPHYDRVQSNGVLRAADFDGMMRRHPGEVGIGVDHWAALEVEGDRFRVVSLEGKGGSVLPDGGFSSDRLGVPGVWIKEVVSGGGKGDEGGSRVSTRLCPDSGRLEDILRRSIDIVEDPRVDVCRRFNPLDELSTN